MSEFSQILLDDLVAIEVQEAEASSTIKLVSWARSLKGHVRAVGPGKMMNNGRRAEMVCQVGDFVTFGAASGMESGYDGKLFRIMHDGDVDCVLDEVAA